jgi:hypothetical protein
MKNVLVGTLYRRPIYRRFNGTANQLSTGANDTEEKITVCIFPGRVKKYKDETPHEKLSNKKLKLVTL